MPKNTKVNKSSSKSKIPTKKNKVLTAKNKMTAKKAPAKTVSKTQATPKKNLSLKQIVLTGLEDMKANKIKVLDVRKITLVTDYMIIATGNTTRHNRAIAKEVQEKAKKAGFPALGIEGLEAAEWVLLDLNDVVVHIMLQDTREFYALEKLWGSFDPVSKPNSRKK